MGTFPDGFPMIVPAESMADVCKFLAHYPCGAGDTLLRAAIAKSPHRIVQGYARFSLALSLKSGER